jgi:hypothetical protein
MLVSMMEPRGWRQDQAPEHRHFLSIGGKTVAISKFLSDLLFAVISRKGNGGYGGS